MRTLALLAALLLLAFQARAQTLQETVDQVPSQDQPGVKDQEQPETEDKDLLGDEGQDMAISFTGEERFARQLTGPEIVTLLAVNVIKRCHCRRHRRCRRSKVNKVLERLSGTCRIFGRQYKLCCN